jgi:hypothetical protein
MTAKQVRASKIKGWIKQYGTVGAVNKVREISGDDLRSCHLRVLNLIKLWRDKGCDVRRINLNLC